MCACSVVSSSLQPLGLWPTRLLCPCNSSGKNTGVGCHAPFQKFFPNHRSTPSFLHLLHWQADSLPLSHMGSPSRVYMYPQTHQVVYIKYVQLSVCASYLIKQFNFFFQEVRPVLTGVNMTIWQACAEAFTPSVMKAGPPSRTRLNKVAAVF